MAPTSASTFPVQPHWESYSERFYYNTLISKHCSLRLLPPQKISLYKMSFLKTIIASSALAIALLATGPTQTNALATSGHAVARNVVGVSPAHHGIAKRKRNSHRNRKRCLAQNSPAPSSTSTSAQGNGNPPPAYTPPAQPPANNNPPPPTSYNGHGKVGLGWAPDVPQDFIINAVTASTG